VTLNVALSYSGFFKELPGATLTLTPSNVPNIAFGAQTTLAHSQNSADTGGTLTVTDGRHAAAIALLGNYMAGSFVAAADGHGATLAAETLQAHQPLPLSHPRA
jgi:Ca2+-binding RTX toxin-like protein